MKRTSSTSSETASTPAKKSRTRLSIAQKREVLKMLKSGATTVTLAKQFNCGAQTIRDIKKKEADLDRYQISHSSPSSSDRLSLRVSKLHHVDQATY